MYTTTTIQFTSWDDIPNMYNLRKIKNAYVDAFHGDIVYVSYALDVNNIPIAFGSAGYYEKESHYSSKIKRHLWIEGMVSTKKGLGKVILDELEQCLIQLAEEKGLEHKVINVVSVDDSVGFYESCGYTECKTSSRWRGVECTKLVKNFGDIPLSTIECIYENDTLNNEWSLWLFVAYGRKKLCEKWLNLPKELEPKHLCEYVKANIHEKSLFKDHMTSEDIKRHSQWFLERYDEIYGE